MKVVILAAGKSSRFLPYRLLPHKSFFSLMGLPIIEYTIKSVKNAGIKDVIIVVSKNSHIPYVLGDGQRFGVSITYVEQLDANGQGDALLAAKDYLSEDFFLLNAHRFDFADFKDALIAKKQSDSDIVLLGKKENVQGKFGMARVKGDQVLDLIEKPTEVKLENNIRVIGIYLFNSEFIKVLQNTPTDHYQLEAAIDKYAKTKTARIAVTDSETFSLKYAWDLLALKKQLFKIVVRKIAQSAQIAPSAQIVGDVIIEKDVKIMENAVIKGPVFIGEGSIIGNNALVRDYSVIGKKCTVGMNTEIKNSILGDGSSIHSGLIEDSVVGTQCKIGALFCSSNVRIDRDQVTVITNKGKLDTGLKALGTCIGDNVKIGVRVTTMPGILIGNNSIVGPSTTVIKNISENTKYYTTFQEVVEKNYG